MTDTLDDDERAAWVVAYTLRRLKEPEFWSALMAESVDVPAFHGYISTRQPREAGKVIRDTLPRHLWHRCLVAWNVSKRKPTTKVLHVRAESFSRFSRAASKAGLSHIEFFDVLIDGLGK